MVTVIPDSYPEKSLFGTGISYCAEALKEEETFGLLSLFFSPHLVQPAFWLSAS